MDFSEAERYKRDEANHAELLPVLKPVIEKVASIISRHVAGRDVDGIYLVGGTCCLNGIRRYYSKDGYSHVQTEKSYVCHAFGDCKDLYAECLGLEEGVYGIPNH